jgi:hypothetical protein
MSKMVDKIISVVDTNLDRIVAYLQDETGNVYLPDSLHKLLDRLDYIDNLIRGDLYWDRDVIPMIMKKYDIGKAQAYRLINATKYVHRSTSKADKMYEMDFMWHLSVRTFRLAQKANNLKQMNTAISNMHKLWKDRNQDVSPYEDLQQHQYFIVIPMDGGKKNVKLNLNDIGEAIPYEEVQEIVDSLNTSIEETQIEALLEENDQAVIPK